MSTRCPWEVCALCTIRGKWISVCFCIVASTNTVFSRHLHSYALICLLCQPFDEDYLNHLDPPVKHMSFHAYIRKLTGGADKWETSPAVNFEVEIPMTCLSNGNILPDLICHRGKFAALENISCKIKSGCEGHPPWPEGICTKCQPSAITLNRQVCACASVRGAYIECDNSRMVHQTNEQPIVRSVALQHSWVSNESEIL